jgi:uncharacterized protein YqgC (DUF456 family)
MSTATLVAAVLIAFGLVRVLLPILPGLLLVWAGIAVWAFGAHGSGRWVVLGGCTLVLVFGLFISYVLPGKRLRDAGVPWITLVTGGVLGVIGFFLIPLIGLPIGFVVGVYLAESLRLGSTGAAWPTTRDAITALGLGILVELSAGLIAATIWVAGVLIT